MNEIKNPSENDNPGSDLEQVGDFSEPEDNEQYHIQELW